MVQDAYFGGTIQWLNHPMPAGQAFGFAASIAALPTTWPISLACSASARICACTYSLCTHHLGQILGLQQ